MKSDTISKNTESNNRTIICTTEDNVLLNQGNIHFKFFDNSIHSFDLATISCINPLFFANLTSTNDIEIILPKSITFKSLMDLLFIFKNGFGEFEHCSTEVSKRLLVLLQISEFFQNDSFSIEFIKSIILNKINTQNAVDFLKFSYDKLSNSSIANKENDNAWFDLFYKSLETISKSIDCFIENIEMIKMFDSKVLNELIDKMCSHLILGNYILIDNIYDDDDTYKSNEIEGENYFDMIPLKTKEHYHQKHRLVNTNINGNNDNGTNEVVKIEKENFISIENIQSLISLLYEQKKCNNFFDLITIELTNLYSADIIRELNDLPHPTFQVKIPYDFENFYEEYSIDLMINNKKVIFVVYYKQSEDSFNVSIKLSDSPSINNSNDNNNHSIWNKVNSIAFNQPHHQSKSNYQHQEQYHQNNNFQSDEKFCFKILSFFSIVKINDNMSTINASQMNMKSLSNKKSMNTIFHMSNFKSLIKSKVSLSYNGEHHIDKGNNVMMEKDGFIHLIDDSINEMLSFDSEAYFTLKIYLKLCFTHSVLASYLLRSYDTLCYDPKINKISKQLLLLMIKNKYLHKRSEDELVIGIINWLNDEINIKEDITELFEMIQWDMVSSDLIFELLIKYSHMIINEDLENIFIKAFDEKMIKQKEKKGNTYSPSKDLLESFFNAAKRVKYHSIYNQMIKTSKFSMIPHSKPCKTSQQCTDATVEDNNIGKGIIESKEKDSRVSCIINCNNRNNNNNHMDNTQSHLQNIIKDKGKGIKQKHYDNKRLITLFNRHNINPTKIKTLNKNHSSLFQGKDFLHCKRINHIKLNDHSINKTRITDEICLTCPNGNNNTNTNAYSNTGDDIANTLGKDNKKIVSITMSTSKDRYIALKNNHSVGKYPRYITPVKNNDYLQMKYESNGPLKNSSKSPMKERVKKLLNKTSYMNRSSKNMQCIPIKSNKFKKNCT